MQVGQPLGTKAIEPPRSLPPLADQPGFPEHLQVLGDRRLGHGKARRHPPRAQLSFGQQPQDLPAGGLGDCLEPFHDRILANH